MKYVIWILVIALLVAHQDCWYWNDSSVVFGFLPIGLFYHACLSVAASFVWLLACTFAWPKDLHGDLGEEIDALEKSGATANASNAGEPS